MAFCSLNLHILANTKDFTLWQYRTLDRIDAVLNVQYYFMEAFKNMHMRPGDMVMINCKDVAGKVVGTMFMVPEFGHYTMPPPKRPKKPTGKDSAE